MKEGISITPAGKEDLSRILQLQKLAFQSEAEIYGVCAVSPLFQTLESLQAEFASKTFLKATVNGVLAGSIRISRNGRRVRLEKLIVHPESQNCGLGNRLMAAVEERFPDAEVYELMTGRESGKNIHLYSKLGYKIVREATTPEGIVVVWMEKCR